MDKVRRHIIFYGYVQGVGFDDGSVEMEAEGTERDIEALINAMEEHSWGSVERVESKLIPLHGDHNFDVR